MSPGSAANVWERWQDLLAEAASAIECAERNVGRRNGWYSTYPQLMQARKLLQDAIDLLPKVEEANEVLA